MAEKKQLVDNRRNKGGGKSERPFHGRKLSRELQQLTEEMSREFTTKRRIKITNLPYNVQVKVRTSTVVVGGRTVHLG